MINPADRQDTSGKNQHTWMKRDLRLNNHEAARHAHKELWEIAKSADVLSEKRRILARYINPERGKHSQR